MSFYSMMFGRNSQSEILLAVLGIKEVDVPRFRDVFTSEDGSEIIIHTRTGGGNREGYWEQNAALTKLPGYKCDYDDEGDNTYANFEFEVPEEWRQDVQNLSSILEHGLRAEFCQHIATTLTREPTEKDQEQRAIDAERAALKRTDHFMANGHTFVPLSDGAMEAALKLAEENGGELQSCWGIAPINVTVKRDFDEYGGMTRVKTGYDFGWSMDHTYWTHCQDKFSDQYPKAMAKVAATFECYKGKKMKATAETSPALEEAKAKIERLENELNRANRRLDAVLRAVA